MTTTPGTTLTIALHDGQPEVPSKFDPLPVGTSGLGETLGEWGEGISDTLCTWNADVFELQKEDIHYYQHA